MEERKLFYRIYRGGTIERRKYFRGNYTNKQDVEILLRSHKPVQELGSYTLGLEDADGEEEAWESVKSLPAGDITVVVTPSQGVGSSEDVQQVMQAVRSEWDSRDKETRKLLEPISKVCLDKLSETRCASKINKDDLQCVRDAFKTNLQVVDAQNDAFAKPEDFWNERYEVETAADYLKGWVRTPRELEWNDARGHVLRSKGFAGNQLDFPISSSNDLILALRQYRRDLELGCFLGLEMKRGLTAKGLRQAEVEFYLWGGCSLFPFVQVITDMQTGGAAFYKTGNSASGHNIVKQYFQSMDSVREFVKGIILSIPDNAGKDGPGGMMIIPRQLENPTRKRRREDTPEPDAGGGGTGGTFKRQQLIADYERGYRLIAAMQPDAGNELLHELDDFPIPPWTDTESAAVHVS